MRALVLGGTGWLGRAIVRELLTRGADVTCLARGESGDVPAGATLVRADRRSADAYDRVRGGWDEVVEISYEPAFVESALDALADTAAHWTLVSSLSVYADNDEPDADETAVVVEPTDLGEYADAKVHAERATAARIGSRLMIVRAGLIVGPGDPSDRFGYWPARFSRGGAALVPTSEGRFVQVIDVEDLAAWIARVGLGRDTGVVNATGDALAMSDFFRRVRDVTDHSAPLIEVDDETLRAHDVRYWAGPRSLPLWLPPSDAAFALRSIGRFRESGGVTRPLEHTVAAVAADERARGLERERRSGLTRAEEDAVLVDLG